MGGDVTDAAAQARFQAARVAYLATADAAGVPHIVPVTFAALSARRLVTAVDAKRKSTRRLRRLANIGVNPRVSMLVSDYHDADWTRLWWVRVDGVARIVESGAEYDGALTALRAKYRQYQAEVAINGPALVVEVERFVGWSMTPDPD
jgi:PPOX class probable F420-dependent enzyme